MTVDPNTRAAVLSEALPFFRRYSGKTVVVKYGGHAMGDEVVAERFAADVVLLKQVGINPIVVKRLRIKSDFIDGLRVTDRATVEIVEMVLSGSINKQIVSAINARGGYAIGLSGKDANLIRARKLTRTKVDPDSNIERILDLGFVGEPEAINATVLETLRNSAIVPVIAPIGVGDDGQTYNINADTVAGAVAGAVKAARFLLLTDVAGVLDKSKALIAELTAAEARRLIEDGTIGGGMIPKVETCLGAIEQGVEAAVIVDGRVPHAILLELFAEGGAGTLIKRGAGAS